MNDIVIGAAAQTADGKHLGKITDIQDGYVRIEDEHGAPPYWLAGEDMSPSLAAEDRVEFRFNHGELDQHIVPLSAADVRQAAGDRSLLPSEDEQRASMLADVAETHEQMEVSGAALPGAERRRGEPVEEELARMSRGAGQRDGAASD